MKILLLTLAFITILPALANCQGPKLHELVSIELNFKVIFPETPGEVDRRVLDRRERVFNTLTLASGKTISGQEAFMFFAFGPPDLPFQTYFVKVKECQCYANLSDAEILAEYQRMDHITLQDKDWTKCGEIKDITVNGHPGREHFCTLSDQDGGLILGDRIFIYRSRMYEVAVIALYSGNTVDPNLNAKTRMFVESFSFLN